MPIAPSGPAGAHRVPESRRWATRVLIGSGVLIVLLVVTASRGGGSPEPAAVLAGESTGGLRAPVELLPRPVLNQSIIATLYNETPRAKHRFFSSLANWEKYLSFAKEKGYPVVVFF
eukprot:RCo012230